MTAPDDRARDEQPAVPGAGEPHTIAAFLACDHDEAVHYDAVMEAHGPAVVERIIQRGLDAGQLIPTRGLPGETPIAFAALDVVDRDGDVIDDYVIPSYEAFAWWRKAIELRATSSDCRICEPAAFAATYEEVARG